MKAKPNGKWFIFPIILLIIGIVIPAILFYQAVMSPLLNLNDVALNESNQVELVPNSWISLFVEDENILEWEVRDLNDTYTLIYNTRLGTFSIELDIRRVDGTDEDAGFYVQVFDPTSEAFTVDEFTNFADINITEEGTYEIVFGSFDVIDEAFRIQYSDYREVGVKVTYAVVIFLIGFFGAIGSFITIIVLRGKNNARIQENNEQLDDSFKKKRILDQKEETNDFDY